MQGDLEKSFCPESAGGTIPARHRLARNAVSVYIHVCIGRLIMRKSCNLSPKVRHGAAGLIWIVASTGQVYKRTRSNS